MRRIIDKRNDFGTIWSAKTKHFYVSLILEQSFEKYDGDDEDGEIQTAIDNGEYVIFDSKVVVECNVDGTNLIEIGADYLGASVYESGKVSDFIHGGYFADMLSNACNEAREHMAKMPRLREF